MADLTVRIPVGKRELCFKNPIMPAAACLLYTSTHSADRLQPGGGRVRGPGLREPGVGISDPGNFGRPSAGGLCLQGSGGPGTDCQPGGVFGFQYAG